MALQVDAENAKALRQTMDDFKSKLQDSVIILASDVGDKVALVATVPKSETDKVKAGDLIKIWHLLSVVKAAAVQIWLKAAAVNQAR